MEQREDKMLRVGNILREAVLNSTKSIGNWQKHLDFTAQFYKYGFLEQLLIESQRPNATMCATYDTWKNKLGRQVRDGANGIPLLTERNGKISMWHVFDVSDTVGNEKSAPIKAWEMKPEYRAAVAERLGKGSLDGYISARIDEILKNIADKYTDDIFQNRKDSLIDGLDRDNISLRFREIVKASAKYAIEKRCGLEPDFNAEDHKYIGDFNTRSLIIMLGKAVNGISSTILREIEAQVKAYEKTLNKEEQHYEEKLENEYNKRNNGSIQRTGTSMAARNEGRSGNDISARHGNDDIHTTNSTRAAGGIRNGDMGKTPLELSEREQTRDVRRTGDGRSVGASGIGGQESGRNVGDTSGADERSGGSERRTEEERPHRMGGETQRNKEQSPRDNIQRADIRINEKAGERSSAFSDSEDIIGNVPFRFIKDKTYIKKDTETALAIADRFNEEGLKYSGRINGDTTTLTVYGVDKEKADSIANEVVKELRGFFDDEQIRIAKETNIVDYLASKGIKTKRVGSNEYTLEEHDSMRINGSKFYWNSQQMYGNALNFAINYLGMDFKTAVGDLLNFNGYSQYKSAGDFTPRPAVVTEKTSEEEKPHKIYLYPLVDDAEKVVEYLTKTRGINEGLVRKMVEMGAVAQDERGNAVFNIRGVDKQVTGAEITGTSGKRFKRITENEGKGFWFTTTRDKKPEKAIFFESAIDAVSYFNLNPHDEALMVSMGGLKDKVITTMLKKTGISYENAFLAADNDEAGKSFAAKMKEKYNISSISIADDYRYKQLEQIGTEVKDWNELLINSENKKYEELAKAKVDEFKAKTAEKFKPIERTSLESLEFHLRNIVDTLADAYELDLDVVDVMVTGSRSRGIEDKGSDIDVLVAYNGDVREDHFFNILNDENETFEGLKIDFNPKKVYDMGDLAAYLIETDKYLDEKAKEKARQAAITQHSYSKWDYTANPVGGEMLYSVFRLKDKDSIDYSGNREYPIPYVEDKEICIKIAERLNAENIVDLESAKKIGEEMLVENEKAKEIDPYKTAKELISEYIDEEFSTEDKTETPDFSDLKEVGLAHTTVDSPTDEELTVQADADLIDREIRIYVDDILVKAEIFDNDTDFNARLANLSFGDLTFISDEMWKEYYNETSKEKGYDTEKTAGNIEPGDIFFINKKICTVVAADSSPLAMVSFERNIGGVDFLGTMPMKKERLINDGIFVGRDDSAVTIEPETKTPEEKIEAEDVPESKPETNEEDHTEMDIFHRIFRGRNDDELKLIYRKSPAELVTASITKESINTANDMAADAQHFFKLLEAYSNPETVRLGDLFYMQAENEYKNGIPIFDVLDNDTYNALVNFAEYGEFEKPEQAEDNFVEEKIIDETVNYSRDSIIEALRTNRVVNIKDDDKKREDGKILYKNRRVAIGDNGYYQLRGTFPDGSRAGEEINIQNLGISVKEALEYIEDNDLIVSGISERIMPDFSEREDAVRIDIHAPSIYKDMFIMCDDIEGTLYLGKTENYKTEGFYGVYDNSDNSLEVISDGSKLYDLFKKGAVWSESREEAVEKFKFSEEDFVSFSALVRELSKKYQRIDAPSFAGQKIEPEIYSRDDLKLALNIGEVIYFEDDDNTSVIENARENNLVNRCILSGDDGNFQMRADMIKNGSVIKNVYVQNFGPSVDDALDYIFNSGMKISEVKDADIPDASKLGKDKELIYDYNKSIYKDMIVMMDPRGSVYLGKEENYSSHGFYGVYDNSDNSLYELSEFDNMFGLFSFNSDYDKTLDEIVDEEIINYADVDEFKELHKELSAEYEVLKIPTFAGEPIVSTDEPENSMQRVYDAVYSNYKGMMVMQDIDDNVYLGKRENYTPGEGYDNSDDSLVFVSSNSNIYKLLRQHCSWTETQTELMDGKVFSKEDFIEFKALRNGVLSQFKELALPTFDGEPFEPVEEAVPEKDENFIEPSSLDYSVYDGYSVMIYDDMVFMGETKNIDDAGRYDNSSDSIIHISGNKNMFTLLSKNSGIEPAPEKYIADGRFTREDFEELTEIKSTVLIDLKETFESRLIKPFYPENQDVVELSMTEKSIYKGMSVIMDKHDGIFLGKTENIDKFGNYNNDDDSLLYLTRNNAIYSLLSSENVWTESQEEILDKEEAFDTDDFIELTNLMDSTLSGYEEEYPLTFAGKPFEPVYPEDLIANSTTEYKIYQMKSVPENRGIRFEPYGSLYNRGIEPDVSRYDFVYEGKLESKEDLTSDEKLEKLFYIFNKERPDDFTGHSLSVSDVVVLNENGNETAHFVDDIGFADIPEFFVEKQIGLKDIVDRFFSGDDTVIESPDGEWKIANGGYDLVAEIYHNGIPVCGVINDLGTYEVEAYNSDVEDAVKTVTDVLKNKGIEFKKIYQVITNAGLDGGIDDKLEYATLDEAVKAGKEYLDDDYLGFAVLNTKTKKIEQVEGEYPLEAAFNDEILKINGIDKPVDRGTITMRKVGDFWEFYGINARNAAETLSLKLSRKNNDDMCGFPDFAKDDFCKELRAAGYTVLIEEVFELDSPKVEKEPENAAEGIETSDELPIVKINIEADAEQITELKAHLENNGYDVKWSELYKSLEVDFENADFVETILQDRNIEYTVDTEDLKKYLDETENTADEEYILSDFILNNMPDPTMTVEDRNEYGYTWNGMLPLSSDRAKELFEHDHSIYQLGDDNTEHLMETADEISDSFMYGIEAEEWEKSLNTELAKEEQDGEIYVLSEEILKNMPDPSVTIEDRNKYGYKWNGILPVTSDKAKELIDKFTVYELHRNNTADYVERANDILETSMDGTLYGISAAEWENYMPIKAERNMEITDIPDTTNRSMTDFKQKLEDIVGTDNLVDIVKAFNENRMHGWQGDQIKENKIKKAFNDILGDEDIVEQAFDLYVQQTESTRETIEYFDDLTDSELGAIPQEETGPFSFANKGQNYKITDYNFNVAGPKERFKNNVAAIRLLKELEESGAQATPEQQEVLAKYVGWGGISMAFEPFRENWTEEYKELKELLTEDEYASASASVLNSHYTPPEVIETVYKGLENLGFAGGRILEPSMGVGAFFGMLPESMEDSKLYGVELDSVSGRIAKQLYPNSNIQIKGFEKTGFTSNVFDVAVGNVPFGNYKLSDTEFRRGNLIHDYFFKKALDKVHPGGIVAFITSKGTLDKRDDTVRRYLAERAELIGAIRLPNNVFSNANAKVVSDIIFLQKREEPLDLSKDENVPSWVKVKEIDEELYTQKAADYGNKIYINSYFAEHPEMIAGDLGVVSGQYGFDLTCKPRDYRSLSEDLDYIVKNIQGEYRQNGYDISEDLMSVREENDIIVENYRNFCYAVIDDEIYFRDNEIMEKQDFDGKKAERVKALVHLSGVLQELITAQREGCSDETLHKLQSKLNTKYDKFTDKYGLITNKLNRAAFRLDDTAELLASLENVNEKGELISKADIFTKRTIEHYVPIESVDTAVEALAVSISEKAHVDLEFMSQLCSKTVEDIVEDLKGVIFKNPETGNYENADEYLSGNVRKKLEIAQLKAVENEEYAVNAEFLRSVQPEELKPEEITVQLGSTWVPVHYYEEFMYQLLDTPHSNRSDYVWRDSDRNPFASRGGDNSTVTVAYDAETSTYGISNKSNYNAAYTVQASQTYGTSRVNAYKILEDTLNLKPVKVMDVVEDEFGKKKSVLNEKETLLAQQKQEEIKAAFAEWLFDDYERTQDICQIYNEKFNSVRPREYDGSHLNLVGMNSDIKLGKHQLNGIARTIYGGNTLLAHCVGAGKTYQMIASAMESKRLGLCHKSLIVVPKHIVKQVASDFMKLYPNANILLPAEGDFSKANRERFCSRIATGSYDAVIISHNQLEKIPISPERQERYLQDEINDIVAAIERMSDNEGDNGFSIKQLESKKKALQDRLEKLYDGKNKDSVVFFEELGVDRMYIDEAHLFKNLNFNTKMSNVAGINSSNPSKRASDVFMKCRYLDELTDSKGCVFATGTPLSNSMVELYIMQTFLQREKLKELGLDNFDAWASSFGSTTQALELAPEGKGYRMKTRFSKFFNIPELMKLFKETADIQTPDMLKLPVPEAEYITVATEASDFQIEMIDALAERAKAVRQGHVDPTVDNMLKITNEGRKLALDQRLANPLLPDDAESKVNQCINNVFNIWDETKPDRSTQMIFCDLSTPHYDGEFNVYDDIKQKLVNMGIPKEEIAFIHDCKTDDQKQKMFEKVNSGEIRILLGSTSKMGTGTNAQERLIAAHHLDTPWRPSDLNQREGRIIRRGNRNKKVKIFTYVTKNTFDSYLYQLVENKQRFISQIMTSKSPARSAEDVDEAVLSYAQIKAIASGDERIKEKMDLDIEVGRLRMIYSGYKETKRKQQNNIAKEYPQKIKFHTAQIEGIAKDIALAQAHESEEFKEMTVLAVTHTDKKEAAEALLKACRSLKFGEHNKDVGTYKGFDMSVTFNARENSYELTLKGAVSHTLKVGADAFGNITRIENALKKLPEELERHKLRLAETETALEEAKKVVDKPFPQLEELKIKEQRLEELNRIFADDSGDTPQNGSDEHSHDKSEHGRNDKYSR